MLSKLVKQPSFQGQSEREDRGLGLPPIEMLFALLKTNNEQISDI